MGIGEIYALGCAVVWACAVMFFKRLGASLPPFELNLFKNTLGSLGFVVVIGVLLALGTIDWPDWNARHILALSLSGVLGVTLADSMMLRSLNLLGAGRMAVVDCLYTPCMILGSFLFIAEPITIWHGIGAVFVLSGVLIAAFEAGSSISIRDRNEGVFLGATSMLIMAFSITAVRPLMDEMPLLFFVEIRLVAAVIAGVVYLMIRRRMRATVRLFQRRDLPWLELLTGSFLGAFLGMALWIAGFKYTNTSTAAILNQSSLIFILILAAMFLGEKMTPRKLAGAAIAFAGICITSLVG